MNKIKDHLAPIYRRVTVDARRIEISLKKWIDPNEWNNKKGLARGTREEVKSLNHFLEEVKAKLMNAYQEMQIHKQLITAASRPREFYEGMSKIKARIKQRARWRKRLQLTILIICLAALVVAIPYVRSRVQPVPEQHSLTFTNVTVAHLLAVVGHEHGVRIDVSDPTLLACFLHGNRLRHGPGTRPASFIGTYP